MEIGIEIRLLTRRPAEHPATQQVKVEMINGLARARIDVEHGTVALLMDIGLHGKFLGDLK